MGDFSPGKQAKVDVLAAPSGINIAAEREF